MDKVIIGFSVLMSVYKNDKPLFLDLALKSIWDNQTLKPNEIVLVEDGLLNEDLLYVIKQFESNAPLKVIKLPKNLGLGAALNEGLKNCSFDLVARMDADDISKPDRFYKQIIYYQQNPHIDIFSSYIDEFVENIDNVISVRKVPISSKDCANYIKFRCPLNHPAVMFKKKKILEVGGYKHFHLKEDIYLWLRLYEANANFGNIPESLLLFRTSLDMYSRRKGLKYAISEFKIFKFRHKIGLINLVEFVFFSSFTIFIRLLPKKIIPIVYKILRFKF